MKSEIIIASNPEENCYAEILNGLRFYLFRHVQWQFCYFVKNILVTVQKNQKIILKIVLQIFVTGILFLQWLK